MDKLMLLQFFVFISTAYWLCSAEDEDLISVASVSNDLGADIHKELSVQDENVFFSPLSISVAIAMILYGSKGETAEEISRILGYQDKRLTNSEVHTAFKTILSRLKEESTPDNRLYVANAVVTQKGFPIRPEYKNGLQSIYNAAAIEVDFQNDATGALEVINDWVKRSTNNQIEKLVDDIDPATVMALLNAVYFKGTWKTQFDPQDTYKGIFYNRGSESEQVTVPMMMLTEELPYARLGGVRVLELPYKNEDISLVILLPDDRKGLARLEQELTRDFWGNIMRQTRKTEVTVVLPKFKLEYEKNLNQALQLMGIKSIFNNPDLSGINKDGSLKVSEIVHKAVVEINEEGSEASAISGGLLDFKMGGESLTFNVNHPFLFAIASKKNHLIIFQGRINKL